MRLIGTLENEKEAHTFYSFLLQERVENMYETKMDKEMGTLVYPIWVLDEDHLEKSQKLLEAFKSNPSDSKYQTTFTVHPKTSSQKSVCSDQNSQSRVLALIKSFTQYKNKLTKVIVLICVIFYIWDGVQKVNSVGPLPGHQSHGLTPLGTTMMYDYPTVLKKFYTFMQDNPETSQKKVKELSFELRQEFDAIETIPIWVGLYDISLNWPESKPYLDSPRFTNIKQGQVWRVITPCIMHGGFLHLLFNMLWLWLLGVQLEDRLSRWRYCLIMIIIGIVSNTMQYLMSGPFFLGYSGIIAGLAGFIWMRQKIAPWEGYPLQRRTVVFLTVFILGMLILQVLSFILVHYKIANFPVNIANTAHIVGALMGIALARIPLLAQGK